jgi:predicted PurR-regulated permease PerM
MNNKTVIEVTTGTMIRVMLVALLFVVIYLIRDVMAVLFFSVIIASAIEPAAHWCARYRIPRILGVLFIYLSTVMILASTFYILVPPLLDDLSDFATQFPTYIKTNIPAQYIFAISPNFPDTAAGYLKSGINALRQPLEAATGGLLEIVSSVFGGVIFFVLTIVISFYLSVQEHGIENFLRVVTPKEYEPYVMDLWKRSRHKIGRWMQGQILLGILVGTMVFLGLTIMQVNHALTLAIFSAIFELIPMFGPVMAAIPAVLFAFIQKPMLGFMVLGFYVLVQQFENHLIYPLVVGQTVGVSPLVVVLSLIIGAKLAGFFGFVLAVPIAAIITELTNDFAKSKE